MKRRVLVLVLALGALLALSACARESGGSRATTAGPVPVPTATKGERTLKTYTAPPGMVIDPGKKYQATMHTTKGDIVFELFAAEAPKTVNNFVFLARDGFYDGVKFHRIMKGFMVQSGDPTGTGAGGPGYRFEDEPVTRNYVAGTLAMANAGSNTNGSQFFIVHKVANLPKSYTIFGIVTKGMDVVDRIASTPVVANRWGEMSLPTEDVLITGIEIQEVPAASVPSR
ncbi:MAG: peptidylprolyl isomerase [Chloroflexota bacterium]